MIGSSDGASNGQFVAGSAKWWTLAACCVTLFMAILDNTVVNVALPRISDDLGATPSNLQWIVASYILVFASLQITAGGLGDRFGRKRFFLIGIAIFTVTSGIAAFANSVELLIAMRAAQGIGAAFILPLTLSLISVTFPPEERGRAIGIWSAISVSGLAFGPIVGGLTVDLATWHWVFLINVPIGIAGFIITMLKVRESRDTSGNTAIDIPGTVLITAAIGSLTWGLIEAGEKGWTDPMVVASLVAAAIIFPLFVLVELRTERPMVPLSFFRSTTFTGANVSAFAISFLIAGVAFSLSLYFQNVHGYSALRSGAAILPLVIVMMIGAPIAGILVGKVGPRRLMSLGMLITGVGMLLFLRADVSAGYLDVLPAYVVMGLGNSLLWAPMTTAVLNSVHSSRSGVASAVNGALREVGTAFGIAVLGTVMNQVYRNQFQGSAAVEAARGDSAAAPLVAFLGGGINYAGTVADRLGLIPSGVEAFAAPIIQASGEAFVDGMHRAIILSVIVIVLASVVSWFMIRDEVVMRPTAETEMVPVNATVDALAPMPAD